MIIKGKSRGNGGQLGQYLVTQADNERIEIIEIYGLAAEDVPGAVLEMEALGACARSEKPLYHASINPRADERMTPEQWSLAVNRLGHELGFDGQPYVVVHHLKDGRSQYHVVWSRTDIERGRTISDSHNYRKHELVARELEREFGHERVQGAHVERDGRARPERTPSYAEMEQSKRVGLDPREVKRAVTEIWRATDSGQAFAAALSEAGYVLARGDRRDFVIIDPKGGTHSLARRIEGARVKDVRERMADIDASQIPSVAEAKTMQQAREQDTLRQERQLKGGRGGDNDLDWTGKGGMVEQQHSANVWLKEALDRKRSPGERVEIAQNRDEAEEGRRQLRQEMLREFGRELEDERDAGRERERKSSR